ncbi:MAG: biopolymer transport protein ExbB [Psychromonas sp.]|jgi:biopolymer transport protein ExbB|uniref:MotA/TolQ/ExbB proton channel family protein n=1 Tax=Psychromonas sp. TaxID=1884585 RepID=UPI0039E37592
MYSLSLLKTYLGELNWVNALAAFMGSGGPVLWVLALLLVIFWVLALERLVYLFWVFPKHQIIWVNKWQARGDQHSWFARSQRDAWFSLARLALHRYLNLMKLSVALCPMIGLLGTVTGMISVFDVLATQGTAQPRLMATGISMATLPTMVGMVAALVGMFMHSRIAKLIEVRELHLKRLMRSK